MTRFAWCRDKKGAALIYAVMVLLLISTIIIAMTAIASASYVDAVLATSDDQSYYYAKSIGLAVKEQFKDGYNLAKIIAQLDKEEEKKEKDESYDPKVTGTFNVANDQGELVNGTVQMRYARTDDDTANTKIIEVRTACLVNNSISIVTSVYSCEDDSDDETEHLTGAFTDYDVILTNTKNLSFDFAQASDSADTSNLSVYVYAGEDDNVINDPFYLYVNLGGKLTTTGGTSIISVPAKGEYNSITGNLTSYGNMALTRTYVKGTYGVHAAGNVTLNYFSYVKNNIYAKGEVTLNDPGSYLHNYYVFANGDGNGTNGVFGSSWGTAQADNIYAQSNVTMMGRSFITGDILTHGNVTVWGNGANKNSTDGIDHFGNAYVGGSIYADGDVLIAEGATVAGNIVAKGDVMIADGAFVVGNVQSVSGNVTVAGAAVGGQVNCPNGQLWVTNAGFEDYADFLSQIDNETGRIVFGGIGLFQTTTGSYNHTCRTFVTGNSDRMTIVSGNLYVSTSENGVTFFKSVWCRGGAVYLLDSTAGFQDGARTYVGMNQYGNPYTHIDELNQKCDLYNPMISGNPWVDMAGAHIMVCNVGSSNDQLYDAYIYNGFINYFNARCLFLSDMRFDEYANIFATQFIHIYGSGASSYQTQYEYTKENYRRTGGWGAYTYVDGVTRIPSTATIQVACRSASYSGVFTTETRAGFSLGINSEVGSGAVIKVGSSSGDMNGLVQLGDDYDYGVTTLPAKFYGTLHAYVATFTLTGRTRLSTKTKSSDGGDLYAAKIYAEISSKTGNFYVEPAIGTQYRYGSSVQVKGNAYIAGVLYDFKHIYRDNDTSFDHSDDARINGTLVTTGINVNLHGSSVFSVVEATNANATVTLTGALTLNKLLVNGTLNINRKNLTVKGDLYVYKLKGNNLYNTTVSGNLTIENVTGTTEPVYAEKKIKVTGSLTVEGASLTLDKSGSEVGGVVKVSKDLSVSCSSGTITIGKADVGGTLTLRAGGKLTGDFKCNDLIVSGGTLTNDKTTIKGDIKGVYKHEAGTVKYLSANVRSSSSKAVDISGGTGNTVVLNVLNGGAYITGGDSVDYYGGNLSAKLDVTVLGGFRSGITSKTGYVTIGSASDTGSYPVGYGVPSLNPGSEESDEYRVIYAYKDLVWQGGAYSPYEGTIKFALPTVLAARLDVKVGSSGHYIKGFFGRMTSEKGKVTAYVEGVWGVYAQTGATIYVNKMDSGNSTSGVIGIDNELTGNNSGILVNNGDIHVGGATGNEKLWGQNITDNGNFYFDTKMQTDARIRCKKIFGLDNVKIGSTNNIKLALHIKNPDLEDGFYRLRYTLITNRTNNPTTGQLTIGGNLAYDSPIEVQGELRVEGIFKYNGSTEELVSLGGLYCLNTKVNVTSAFRGNIHLPNVTEMNLNAEIGGLNAENVETFNINYNVTGSLSLKKCKKIVVKSGKSIGGSLEINEKEGYVENNGTIGKDVKCGYYSGSGSVGGNLILKQEGKESTITGQIKGKIWSAGSLTITTSSTLGETKTNNTKNYVYAAGNISITNATFHSNVDYILSNKGDITLDNCRSVPKVWNNGGAIILKNKDASPDMTIAGVFSRGTYIYFGTSKDNNHMTITGDVEWHGSYSTGYAMDFWGGKGDTTINGSLLAFGTGNVHTSDATIKGPAHFRNKGTIENNAPGSYEGAIVSIGTSSNPSVTSANLKGTITGNLVVYGNTSMAVTLSGTIGTSTSNYIHVHTGGTLTINGEVKGSVNAGSVTTVELNNKCGDTFTIGNGKLTTKKEVATIGKNLRAYNAELHINANVNGAVTHTAPAISSSNPMKLVALGNQNYQITVNGNITVHGRLVDNSKQIGSNRKIYCKGAYYGDLKKEFNDGCTQLNFTSEDNGNCFLVGYCKGDWEIKNTVFNIDGIFSIYTFYNQTDAKYYKLTFDKEVKCKALIINSEPYAFYTDGDCTKWKAIGSSPSRKVVLYSTSENTSKAKGLDKHAYLVNFETVGAKWLDIYYSSDYWPDSKELVYFKAKVSVSGNCYACNTKFGNQLNTLGQTSLYYSLLYSAGYSSDTNHCSVRIKDDGSTDSSDNLKYLKNDGAFLHTSSSYSGENYFDHVNTFSNVAVYNGVSHIFGGSVFKGCTEGSASGYNGHRSTKLFYFGASVELYGNSRITSNAQADVNIPAGRTIIWVKSGALVVRDESFIGVGRDNKGITKDESGNANTNRHSQHPGVFVSHSSGSVKMKDGVSYEFGSVYVKGSKSSITLDICAYRKIVISDSATVLGKDKKNSTHRYMAGLYITRYGIEESNSGFFGYYHYESDDVKGKSGVDKRKYYTGITDDSAFTPNGSKYRELFNKRVYSYSYDNWFQGDDIKDLTYSQGADALTNYYTPRSSAPTVAAPNGIEIDSTTNKKITTTEGISVSDSITVTYSDAAKPIPDEPELKAEGDIFNPVSGTASVNPIIVENDCLPLGGVKMSTYAPSVSAEQASASTETATFDGKGASLYPSNWTNPAYDVSVSIERPSKKWTSAIVKHFDTDEPEKAYWNTRFIPYVWKLPYEDSSGSATPAKRVLQTGTGDTRERNDELMLKQKNTVYYVNKDYYEGSTLAGIAGNIKSWRSAGMSGGKLADYLVMNSIPEWDGPLWKEPDHKRRTKILVFESGELPYGAFFMGDGSGSDDHVGWSGSSGKSIAGKSQTAWKLGDPDVSFYDCSFVFYTCTDPSNPYKKDSEKDLHVVIPQGMAFEFIRDAENSFTVVGNGRVFLYLTSGDYLVFRSKATTDVYPNVVGGLKKVDSHYEPLLYIIGAGTNIDLVFDCMPLGCFIYMPFGNQTSLYDSSKGSLKSYNIFKNAEGKAYTSKIYTSSTSIKTTSVARNKLTLDWSNFSGGSNRNISGTIVVDNFDYEGGTKGNKLNFANANVLPDLSDTTIYSYSTTTNSKNGGKTYSLSQFLTMGPGFSTSLLKWDYKGVRVVG